MGGVAKVVMERFYRKADGHPERLPWHQDAPPAILEKAVASRHSSPGGRALDLGCGTGVFTVWLAKQKLEVTGVDYFPQAIAMARDRAERQKVDVDLITGDLFDYVPTEKFDLILDSGCLHSLVGGSVSKYRERIFRWLAPGGDYILGHWGKKSAFDWNPIGPRRRSEGTITRLFTPGLRLVDTEITSFSAGPPFGDVRGVGYWFHREK